MKQRPLLRLLAVLAALALFAGACGNDDDGNGEPPPADTDDGPDDEGPDDDGDDEATGDGPTIRVRGQAFSEAETIAEVYGQYLEAKGYDVDILTPAGFRDEAIGGIEAGELDLIVDYIGGSQTHLDPDGDTSSDPDEVMDVITPLFEEIGATVLDYSPAVDGDAFVVRGDSEATTISDVADLNYVFGASAQCFERPQCFLGYTDPEIYDITFADTRTIEFGPLLGEALNEGEVDAVVWNDTAPQIDEFGFKVLEDDLGLHPAQNIAPIVVTSVLEDYGDQLRDDLNELSAMISTDDLLAWNYETDIEFREPRDVAADWLAEQGLS
jgi:osmoprotectant transport system substrate-binding protein